MVSPANDLVRRSAQILQGIFMYVVEKSGALLS